ncbi:Hpm1p [Sugiyamaella lignohabitans]|uniref:protein-histidine N-methyltransferase n=1 Tax=Sugiyamaella lignohabitans TaxID=796027 RepID=A0A161HIV4_9ASCO|nr:Hpm1p [Sugiyamaella lignohabitans]ANB12527.1 Hpm1p [Sugiyamaella lignohabitans]
MIGRYESETFYGETRSAMSFQFGFSGDDIEEDEVVQDVSGGSGVVDYRAFMETEPAIELDYVPKLYTTEELLLPQSPIRMSYSLVRLADNNEGRDEVLAVPRRDLYDVKYQLMKQDSLSATEEILLGTTNEDVRATTYEGGLKVWECTFDLVQVLKTELGSGFDVRTFLELGCGAAIPSSYLFYRILTSGATGIKLVLADYNDSVLRLVTAPNMFLTWVVFKMNESKVVPDVNEVDITPELIDEFHQDMARRNIQIQYVSGAWSPQFVKLLDQKFQLILASETIYSLDTLPVFTDTLLNSLPSSDQGHALVAAKKIYFGVGGGIPDFVTALESRQITHNVVFEDSAGVGRAVLKVSL